MKAFNFLIKRLTQNVCSLQKSSMTCEFFELLQCSKFGVLEIFSKLQQWLKEQGACVFL
jgi:hypothetical protein